jgi:polysaccharide transporter, PST family
MIKKFKDKLKKEDNKVLLSNFLSLSVLQIANFLLPLLAVPYLIRILEIELFGLLAFATAMIMYFVTLSDYGFNLTATREISIHRQSKDKVTEIFSAVMTIKFLLMILGLLILTIVVFLFERLRQDWEIYYLTFGMVIGQALFPIWFFQGMEKMKYISILNVFAKTIFLIGIFIFVHEKEDYYLVPLFNSMGFIIAGIISLNYIKKEFNISFRLQSINTLEFYFKGGWHVFISRAAVVLYTSSNIFILGLFTNITMVGFYSIAEKVIGAISSIGSMINQVLFPYLSKIWSKNQQNYYIKFTNIFKVMSVGMLTIAIIIFMLSPYIINLLSGENIEESTILLRLLSVAVVLFPLGGLFTQSFVTQNKNIFVTKATMYTALVNLFLVTVLTGLYGMYGLAFSVVLVQLFHLYINSRYFLQLKRNSVCAE